MIQTKPNSKGSTTLV